MLQWKDEPHDVTEIWFGITKSKCMGCPRRRSSWRRAIWVRLGIEAIYLLTVVVEQPIAVTKA